ncbi:hypothetical protein [Candidatus Nitrosotenuis uzonensis]|uniref:Conserved flagellar protein F immunoglobulin-like domain-containing protein n=1 Tax=Candidatus Nitrosotenuis uzonensis TaxID=1407055 RepID=A0A812EVY3_9ARCH|nr:hypothetical protein [Candidatus Nitrosotenuis uzonensis]CAE6494799.1 conserved hypothetical protein [Candidatus Nitrosotenuis uzonensis]
MGLGIALMGGIACASMIAVFTLLSSMTTQTHELNSVRTQTMDREIQLSKTNIDIESLYAQGGSNLVSLTLSNTGNEKLWDYENFDVLITYDADVGGVPTLTAERFTYSEDSAFSQDGMYSGSTQFARPDQDILKGGWTDTDGGDGDGTLYEEIDENVRNDADFTRSATLTILGQSDTWQVGLSDVLDPQTSSNHVVRYVYKKSTGGGITVDLTVRLMQGTTQIASWTHNNVGSTFTLATQTLLESEANSITNYADLRLTFVATYTGGILPGRAIDVSWAELEVPAASGVYDCGAVILTQKHWTIDRISDDLIDPKLLNAEEGALICIKLSYPVAANGDVDLTITTDVGKTKTASLAV